MSVTAGLALVISLAAVGIVSVEPAPRRRRVRVPLPPDVPVTVRLPQGLARRLALWLATQGWSPGWYH